MAYVHCSWGRFYMGHSVNIGNVLLVVTVEFVVCVTNSHNVKLWNEMRNILCCNFSSLKYEYQ